MIKSTAYIFARYFANKGQYSNERINVYAYGFEILISTVLNALGLLIISLVFDIVIETFLFSLAFVLLRATAGGYHTKHHWSCFLTVNITFSVFAVILNLMSKSIVFPYIVFATMLSAIMIWTFSPIRAVNNPLSESQKERFRKRSIIVTTFNMVLTLITAFMPLIPIIFIAYYQSGALAASISLTIAAVINRDKR